MFRRITLAVTGGIVFALCASGAATADNGHGPIRGIVPSRGQAKQEAHGGGGGTASNNLVFHGGSVLNGGNTVYAIFWSPSNWSTPIRSSYEQLIERYFGDVAAATNTSPEAASNVYYAATQYGAGISGSSAIKLGSLDNATTFGGYLVDTNPLPASGCRDRATSACVTDKQLVGEINKDVGATSGWSHGQPTASGNHIFFMFTAKGVGSCFGSSCSFTQWCAYHSNSGSLLYANMPYADTSPTACDAGYHPNASIDPDADATLNVTSHENNETITDPFGSAWYDNSGNEDGDKCAWTFGSVSGAANQTINSDQFILQQEWSNATSRCVLTGI